MHKIKEKLKKWFGSNAHRKTAPNVSSQIDMRMHENDRPARTSYPLLPFEVQAQLKAVPILSNVPQ